MCSTVSLSQMGGGGGGGGGGSSNAAGYAQLQKIMGVASPVGAAGVAIARKATQ